MNSARFGRCELRPEERELRVDGKLATLGGRTFDLLLLLVGSAGELVTKEQILGQVWRGTVVEENTLQVHISALRKILGVDRSFIKTISGHGYRFVARVSQGDSARSSAKTVARLLTNIPAPTAELFGRAPELAAVLGLVGEHRMVTLVGAGGMGKTRIGLEAARRLRDRFPDGVWLAQLGALRDPELVASTVAATLQIESTGSNDFAKRIAVELASKTTLLVLDDCEHVIEAAARIAEAVLAASPTVRIIATSRESLRADGERVFRVRGLDVPRPDCDNTAEILGAGAVQLFMARALAAEPRLELDTRTSNAAAVICRRLDGIPLAIELAAARVATLGVEELAARLNDRFSLPSGGRRSALPRHQTLRALIDWSYDLLTEAERVTLRRLAVFAGSVTLAAASTVIPGPNSPTLDVLEGIASLVEKSLVVADVSAGATPCYRMLETTRQYAREKLSESGEFETLARRHALHFLGLLAQAEAEGDTRPAAEWLTRYGPSIDDVRAALTWSFSPTGDTSLGVALTVVATPLLIQCSLIDECRERVDRALSAAVPASSRDLSTEMRLLAARSQSLVHTVGLIPETRASWIRTYELAASLDNAEHQLRALWEQVSVCINTGELAGALELGRKLADLAGQRGDAGDVLAAGRVNGYVLHLLGQHAQARCHLEGGLERAHRLAPQSHFDRYGIDRASRHSARWRVSYGCKDFPIAPKSLRKPRCRRPRPWATEHRCDTPPPRPRAQPRFLAVISTTRSAISPC
jgi:predicted ATPase/DNA-binding winged helix-turn-helix (wHTH) protein